MKKIECIIRPEKLKVLTDKLLSIGIGGMTVTEVKGFGKNTTRPENFLFLPKTKIEIYVTDEQLDLIIETISEICHDKKIGSGKIAVLPLTDCIRVRTKETQEAAIL